MTTHDDTRRPRKNPRTMRIVGMVLALVLGAAIGLFFFWFINGGFSPGVASGMGVIFFGIPLDYLIGNRLARRSD